MEYEERRELILETMESMLEIQLRSVRQLKKSGTQTGRRKAREPESQKRTSMTELCIELLTSEGGSLHVDTMVELLKKRFERSTDRDSLASALAKKARKDERLQRVAPGTYSLSGKMSQ